MTDKTPDPLTLLVGEAIVAWSRVESGWAQIFLHLAYDGFGQKPKSDPETKDMLFEAQADYKEKRDRAAAIYFSIPSGRNQRQMVLALAEIALKEKEDAKKVLRKLARKTDEIGSWRNQLVHAFYDHSTIVDENTVIFSGIEMNPDTPHRFQAPMKEIPERIREFNTLGNQMTQMLLAIWNIDYLPEFGEPEPKTKKAKQQTK